MGLEPTTFSLATRRSTTELRPLIKLILKLNAFYKLSNRLFIKNYQNILCRVKIYHYHI